VDDNGFETNNNENSWIYEKIDAENSSGDSSKDSEGSKDDEEWCPELQA
jgi:hypothetical protein